MNEKTKKRLKIAEQQRKPLGPKAKVRMSTRQTQVEKMVKRHQDSVRLTEYVSVGDAELLDMYNTAARIKIQDRVALVPRRGVKPECPFDQNLEGELIVLRSVAEMLELTYTELTGDQT